MAVGWQGQAKLRRIVRCWAHANPSLTYWQAMLRIGPRLPSLSL